MVMQINEWDRSNKQTIHVYILMQQNVPHLLDKRRNQNPTILATHQTERLVILPNSDQRTYVHHPSITSLIHNFLDRYT